MTLDHLEERRVSPPFPLFVPSNSTVPEMPKTATDEVGGDAFRNQPLIWEDRGELRFFVKMPETDDWQAPFLGAPTQFEIKAARDDAVSFPSGQPRRIRIILAAFMDEHVPRTVQCQVTADSQQDLPSVDFRSLNNERYTRFPVPFQSAHRLTP
jgi:hypothetical protein